MILVVMLWLEAMVTGGDNGVVGMVSLNSVAVVRSELGMNWLEFDHVVVDVIRVQ